MALNLSTLVKPIDDQVIDVSTGVMRDAWKYYFQDLTKVLNAAVGELGTDPAPKDAEYIVGATNATLTAERVATNSTSNTWDLTAPGQAQVQRAALTGDVTASANSNATTIAADAVTNAKAANMAQSTIKGRAVGAGTGDPTDLTATQATAILDTFTSALKGLAPASGGGTANFLRADGTWTTPSGLVLLTSGTVTNAATLDLVLTSYTAYRGIMFVLSGFIPATDDVALQMRLSSNGGVSYDAGASDYRYAYWGWSNSGTGNTQATTTLMELRSLVGNGAAEGADSIIHLLNQTSTAIKPKVTARTVIYRANDTAENADMGGHRNNAQDTDAVRFFFSGASNIASGNYAAYGML
jgi:hypothetical protein